MIIHFYLPSFHYTGLLAVLDVRLLLCNFDVISTIMATDGLTEGEMLGLTEGEMLGLTEGLTEGETLGEIDGLILGD